MFPIEIEVKKEISGFLTNAQIYTHRRHFDENRFHYNMGMARLVLKQFRDSSDYKRLPDNTRQKLNKFFMGYEDKLTRHFEKSSEEVNEALQDLRDSAVLGNVKEMFENVWKLRAYGIKLPAVDYQNMRTLVKKKLKEKRKIANRGTIEISSDQLVMLLTPA